MDNQTGYGIGQGIGTLLRYLIGRGKRNFNEQLQEIYAANNNNLHDTVAYIEQLPDDNNVKKNFTKYTGMPVDSSKFPLTLKQMGERYQASIYNNTVDPNDPLGQIKRQQSIGNTSSPSTVGGSINENNQAIANLQRFAKDENTRSNLAAVVNSGGLIPGDALSSLVQGAILPGQSSPINLPVPSQPAGGMGISFDPGAVNALRQALPAKQPVMNPGVGFGNQWPSLSDTPIGDINNALASISEYAQRQDENYGISPAQMRARAAQKTAEASGIRAAATQQNADTKARELTEVKKPLADSTIKVNNQKIETMKAKASTMVNRANSAEKVMRNSAYAKTEEGQIMIERIRTARELAKATLRASVQLDYNGSDAKAQAQLENFGKYSAQANEILAEAERKAKEKQPSAPAKEAPQKQAAPQINKPATAKEEKTSDRTRKF